MPRLCVSLGVALALSATAFAERRDHPLESLHPYRNDQSIEHRIHDPGAARIVLHFERIELARGDRLTVLDGSGRAVQVYTETGDLRDVDAPAVDGDLVVLRFETDARITRWGFALRGYTATHDALTEPVAIHTQSIDTLDYWSWGKDTTLFEGDSLIVSETYYLRPTVPAQRVVRYRLTPTGPTDRQVLSNLGSQQGLTRVGGELVWASNTRLYQVGGARGDVGLVASPSRRDRTAQLEGTADGFLFAWDRRSVQVIDTRSDFGWHHALVADDFIPARSFEVGAIAVEDRWLVVNQSWRERRLTVFDVRDPYAPREAARIHLPNERDALLPVRDTRPLIHRGHVFMPFGDELRVYEAATGYEVGFLTLPEPVMQQRQWGIQGDMLYAGGQTTVYAIDVADPYRPRLQGTLRVTRIPGTRGLSFIHPVGEHLYVFWRTHLFGSSERAGFALTVYRLPASWR